MVAETSAGCLLQTFFTQSYVALITIRIILFRQKRNRSETNMFSIRVCRYFNGIKVAMINSVGASRKHFER